jgi:hypothetical protein
MVRVEPFLSDPEIVENALLDELRLHYQHAHQIAARRSATQSKRQEFHGSGISAS